MRYLLHRTLAALDSGSDTPTDEEANKAKVILRMRLEYAGTPHHAAMPS